jgi:hypothetical protein
VEGDGLLASYITRLECLKDREKDRSLAYNNIESGSSAPKIYPHGNYPSLAPLPVTNNANYMYGMPPETSFAQNL